MGEKKTGQERKLGGGEGKERKGETSKRLQGERGKNKRKARKKKQEEELREGVKREEIGRKGG